MTHSIISNFNSLDYLFCAIALLTTVTGIIRGFLLECIALSVWLFASLFAIFFASPLSPLFKPLVSTPFLANFVSFIVTWLVTFLVGWIFLYLIFKLIIDRVGGTGGVSRLFGALAGLLKGGVIILLASFIFANTSWYSSSWFQRSMVTSRLNGVITWMQGQTFARPVEFSSQL